MLTKRELFLSLMPSKLKSSELDYDSIRPPLRACAVLLIIHFNKKVPHIVLTKRSTALKDHSGEISFPGGQLRRGDKSLRATAIRETKEELGLAFNDNQIIGNLSPVRTLTSKFLIQPFITLQDNIPDPKIFPDEIESVIDAPLLHILHTMTLDTAHTHLSIDKNYRFKYRNEVIWGATGRILKELHDLICSPLRTPRS
jgi:8-oxo-dGTP pyrophosphatase MutT (NUDIX family)